MNPSAGVQQTTINQQFIRMKIRKILCASAFLASASMAMAQFTPITSVVVNQEWTGSGTGTNLWLQSITAGGNTYATNGLGTGTTTGNPSLTFPVIDDWNLSTLQPNIGNIPTGNASLPIKTVLFGGANWTDSNGSLLDFFLFEVGTGDSITLAAILPGGGLGVGVVRSSGGAGGWGGSLYPSTITQTGQNIVGIGWSITDLLDAGGANLTTSSVIEGIAITAGGGIDPAGFFAVVPVPEPTTMALALLGLGGLALFRKRS